MNRVYIDFEFNRPAEKDMGLICCALSVDDGAPESFWLLDGSDNERLVDRICELDASGHTLVAYNVDMAEGRCVRALGLDPRTFRWIDLMLDWKWLRNGDDRYSYGDVIQSDGKGVSFSIPPVSKLTKRMTKEEEAESEKKNLEACSLESKMRKCRVTNQVAGMGLLDAEYFFGVISKEDVLEDKKTKSEIRDGLIINSSTNELEKNRARILNYCASDIHLMRRLDMEIGSAMKKVSEEDHLMVMDGEICTIRPSKIVGVEEMRRNMGAWASRLAMYSSRGIPMSGKKYCAVKSAVPEIMLDTQMKWNAEHPDNPIYRVGASSAVRTIKKTILKASPYLKNEISMDASMVSDMITRYASENGIKWKKTAAGKPSTDSAYLKEMDDGALINQFRKHRDSLTSLKAIAVDESGAAKMDSYIGSDFRQRPSFGPYGTKTGRNATKASSFIFLGPKWFRILVDPAKGRYVCDLDAHSEEVAIAAALYDDENKRDVYRSADVYMKYAQLAGAYPKDKPILDEDGREREVWFKEEHWDRVRKIYKGGFLGMQFGMGGPSLQRRVALSLPKEERSSLDKDFGNNFVDEYHKTFSKEYEAVSELKRKYSNHEASGIVLQDGWRIGPDDPNLLSIGNFPVQGTGAVILRKACELCDEAGVTLYATLHDAISITGRIEDMDDDIGKASAAFKKAADEVLGEDLMAIGNPEIVRNGEAWLHSSDAKDTWNGFAEKYFSEFILD